MENFDIMAIVTPVITALKGIDWDKVLVTIQDLVTKADPFIKTITKFIADNITPVA